MRETKAFLPPASYCACPKCSPTEYASGEAVCLWRGEEMQPSKASVASACEGEDRSCAGEGAGGGGPGGGGSCGAEAQRPGGRKRRSGRQGKERPERHGTPGLHLVAGAVAPPPPRCLLATITTRQGTMEERHLPPLIDPNRHLASSRPRPQPRNSIRRRRSSIRWHSSSKSATV